MSDFREQLYEGYVRSFKGAESQRSAEALASYFAWCEAKFLPRFRDCGGTLPSWSSAAARETCSSSCDGTGSTEREASTFRRSRSISPWVEDWTSASADVFAYLADKAGAFDAVIALDFVEHFHKDELVSLIPLIHRSLKSGGILIVQTPNGEGLFPGQVIHGDVTHCTIFTCNSLRQLLAPAGFHAFQFLGTGPVGTTLRGKLRVIAWRVITFLADVIRRIETGKKQEIWTENIICSCRREEARPNTIPGR